MRVCLLSLLRLLSVSHSRCLTEMTALLLVIGVLSMQVHGRQVRADPLDPRCPAVPEPGVIYPGCPPKWARENPEMIPVVDSLRKSIRDQENRLKALDGRVSTEITRIDEHLCSDILEEQAKNTSVAIAEMSDRLIVLDDYLQRQYVWMIASIFSVGSLVLVLILSPLEKRETRVFICIWVLFMTAAAPRPVAAATVPLYTPEQQLLLVAAGDHVEMIIRSICRHEETRHFCVNGKFDGAAAIEVACGADPEGNACQRLLFATQSMNLAYEQLCSHPLMDELCSSIDAAASAAVETNDSELKSFKVSEDEGELPLYTIRIPKAPTVEPKSETPVVHVTPSPKPKPKAPDGTALEPEVAWALLLVFFCALFLVTVRDTIDRAASFASLIMIGVCLVAMSHLPLSVNAHTTTLSSKLTPPAQLSTQDCKGAPDEDYLKVMNHKIESFNATVVALHQEVHRLYEWAWYMMRGLIFVFVAAAISNKRWPVSAVLILLMLWWAPVRPVEAASAGLWTDLVTPLGCYAKGIYGACTMDMTCVTVEIMKGVVFCVAIALFVAVGSGLVILFSKIVAPWCDPVTGCCCKTNRRSGCTISGLVIFAGFIMGLIMAAQPAHATEIVPTGASDSTVDALEQRYATLLIQIEPLLKEFEERKKLQEAEREWALMLDCQRVYEYNHMEWNITDTDNHRPNDPCVAIFKKRGIQFLPYVSWQSITADVFLGFVAFIAIMWLAIKLDTKS